MSWSSGTWTPDPVSKGQQNLGEGCVQHRTPREGVLVLELHRWWWCLGARVSDGKTPLSTELHTCDRPRSQEPAQELRWD